LSTESELDLLYQIDRRTTDKSVFLVEAQPNDIAKEAIEDYIMSVWNKIKEPFKIYIDTSTLLYLYQQLL